MTAIFWKNVVHLIVYMTEDSTVDVCYLEGEVVQREKSRICQEEKSLCENDACGRKR